MAKFNIVNKTEKLIDDLYLSTDKSPKKLRHDIVPKLREVGFNIMEDIIMANNCNIDGNLKDICDITPQQRARYQWHCLSQIRVLEATAEICHNRKYLTDKQLEYLITLASELFDMVHNWMQSDQKRVSKMANSR